MTEQLTRAAPTAAPCSPHEIRVESWRVVTEALGGLAPTVDAIVRLRVGDKRVVFTGEASRAEDALDGALRTALLELADPGTGVPDEVRHRLRTECGLRSAPSVEPGHGRLTVSACDRDALLGRLTALMNTHDVTDFGYRLQPDGSHARVEVVVKGDQREITRVANKLRRVIGVIDIQVQTGRDPA
jgi:hypothetical protein